jgi:hypothetical protein
MYYGREGRQSQMQPPPSSVKFQLNSLLGFGEVEFVFGEYEASFLFIQYEQVVENPISSHDGAQFAYQHFENVRNFLVAVEDMGLPAFEASDLEQVQCCRTSKVLKGCWEIFPFSGNPFAIKGCSRGEVR